MFICAGYYMLYKCMINVCWLSHVVLSIVKKCLRHLILSLNITYQIFLTCSEICVAMCAAMSAHTIGDGAIVKL